MDKIIHSYVKEATRPPEYQVVLIVEYDDGRMFPLTEQLPKCLLPIANRKLLAYQIDMMVKSGVEELFIVAPTEFQDLLTTFVSASLQPTLSIEIVCVNDMMGSADAVRAIGERLRGDFICISSDALTQFSLADVVNLHRMHTSDFTLVLSTVAKDKKIDSVDQEYIGITDNGRVVLKTPLLEIDETVTLPKALLNKCEGLNLHNEYIDIGIYVLAHWVVNFIMQNKAMSSLKSEVLPYLLNRQFQSPEYLNATIPALEQRSRSVYGLEAWLVNAANDINPTPTYENTFQDSRELLDYVVNEEQHTTYNTGTSTDVRISPIPNASARNTGGCMHEVASNNTINQSQNSLNSMAAKTVNTDLLRIFAIVYDTNAGSYSNSASAGANANAVPIIVTKLLDIATYLNLNRDIPLTVNSNRVPWTRVQGYMKKESSTVSEEVQAQLQQNKNVTIKQCAIGAQCVVGQMSRLNNSVIMDNVQIGESCMIQNCVIASYAVIENGCSLKDCCVGPNCRVAANSKVKSETINDST